MSEHLNLDYITKTKFVSEPKLYWLEAMGRAILTVAAVENARYGSHKDGLLQLYQHDDQTTRAEYRKTLGTANDRFERLAVKLGMTTMIITLEQGFTDWSGQANVFVDKAIMASIGNSHIVRDNNKTETQEPFTDTSLAQYAFDLEAQIESLEILLPERSFFTDL